MFLVILFQVVSIVHGHAVQPTPRDHISSFVSELIKLEVAVKSNSVEAGRLAATVFAAGLRAYDSEKCKSSHDPDLPKLAAYHAMAAVLKESCQYNTYYKSTDKLLHTILQGRDCRIRETARIIGLSAARHAIEDQLKDEFISFYEPSHDAYQGNPVVKTPVTYQFANYAYKKLICFNADLSTIFKVPPSPEFGTPQANTDWKYLFETGCNSSSKGCPQKTSTQRKVAKFWQSDSIGADGDNSTTIFSQFLSYARHLINRKGLGFREKLQYYNIFSVAMANAANSVFYYQFYYRSWAIVPLMRKKYGNLPYDHLWTAIGNSNPDLKDTPSYPNTDLTICSTFVTVARQLFKHDSHDITVVSGTSGEIRNFHSFAALQAEYVNATKWAGLSFHFGITAGITLGEKVGLATYNLLINGQCPAYCPILKHRSHEH